MEERRNGHLGTMIRQAREKKGISLRRCAVLIGIDKAYLSLLENGLRTNPSLKVLMRVEHHLGVPMTELQKAYKESNGLKILWWKRHAGSTPALGTRRQECKELVNGGKGGPRV